MARGRYVDFHSLHWLLAMLIIFAELCASSVGHTDLLRLQGMLPMLAKTHLASDMTGAGVRSDSHTPLGFNHGCVHGNHCVLSITGKYGRGSVGTMHGSLTADQDQAVHASGQTRPVE